MSAAQLNLEFRMALTATGLVQPVQHSSESRNHFWVLCRQVPGQERAWLAIVEELLHNYGGDVKGSPEVIIARRYILKDAQMVFGWHIGIIAKKVKDIEVVVRGFMEVLEGARPDLTPVVPTPKTLPSFAEQEAPAAPRRPLPPGQRPPPTQKAHVPREEDLVPSPSQIPPPGFKPELRVVQRSSDEKGRPITIEEMPLPHVHREMNRPNAKGRGAKPLGGGS